MNSYSDVTPAEARSMQANHVLLFNKTFRGTKTHVPQNRPIFAERDMHDQDNKTREKKKMKKRIEQSRATEHSR